jgi:hypothetical protein
MMMAKSQEQESLAEQQHNKRQEAYRQTASSLAETVEIGRATATQISQQGEQLQNVETLAFQTEYLLDKSARILKGMTWGGWFQNLLTAKDVQFQVNNRGGGVGEGADVNSLVEKLCPVEQYIVKDPESTTTREAVEAVQNYHIHILLLHHEHGCRTTEEYVSCLEACEKLQLLCMDVLKRLRQDTLHKYGTLPPHIGTVTSFLAKNLTLLNEIYVHYHDKWVSPCQKQQHQHQQQQSSIPSNGYTNGASSDSREFLGSTRYTDLDADSQSQTTTLQIMQQQEAHLDSLIPQLHELTQLSTSIHTSLQEQNELSDRLNDHTSLLTDKTNHVKRRTHAMIQRNAWSSGTASKHYKLDMVVTIQHLPCKKYLSVMGKTTDDGQLLGNGNSKTDPSTIVFSETDQRDASAWLIFKDTRHSSSSSKGGDYDDDKWSLVGLQNALTYHYLGLNTAWFSGAKNGVVCQANAMQTSEQWELEIVEDSKTKTENNKNTKNGKTKEAESWTVRMLHVNANSGNGGYMEASPSASSSPMIGQEAIQHKSTASLWKITKIP